MLSPPEILQDDPGEDAERGRDARAPPGDVGDVHLGQPGEERPVERQAQRPADQPGAAVQFQARADVDRRAAGPDDRGDPNPGPLPGPAYGLITQSSRHGLGKLVTATLSLRTMRT